MDLNFDEVLPAHKSKYRLVTNHGTSEQILSQYNVFKAMRTQITGLNNWINAYKGQVDGLRHELAATKSIGLSGVPGPELLNEVGRRIRRRVRMMLDRSPSS